MIEDHVKIHDQFSIEFKVGFAARRKLKISDFAMNTWIFVPNSLDINRYSYSKDDFYRDTKSNVRLITPIYILRDLANENELPFQLLEKAFHALASEATRTNVAEYESQIKMFQSIFKSSLRDSISHIVNNEYLDDRAFLVTTFIENVKVIAERYRSLRRIINVPTVQKEIFEYYLFGDEFMSHIVESHAFRLLKGLKEKHSDIYDQSKEEIITLIDQEVAYKTLKGYSNVDATNSTNNRELISRLGMLKKYIESQLFLNTRKRKDGAFVEQLYYNIAAGFAMLCAIIFTYLLSQNFREITMPIVVVTVLAYMLREKVKELSKEYFAHKVNRKYYDSVTEISIDNNPIGRYKESIDFITENHVPHDILVTRNRSSILDADNRTNEEKIILYRMLMQLDRDSIDKHNQYPIAGVNNILRFNVSHFIQKMDNPQIPLYVPDEKEGYKVVNGEKIYYLNFLVQYKYEEQLELKRYRIAFNREGIKDIELFN